MRNTGQAVAWAVAENVEASRGWVINKLNFELYRLLMRGLTYFPHDDFVRVEDSSTVMGMIMGKVRLEFVNSIARLGESVDPVSIDES